MRNAETMRCRSERTSCTIKCYIADKKEDFSILDNLNFLQKTGVKLKTLFKDPLANAAKELKEVNSMLTQIKKTADQLSKTDLSNLETAAFHAADKYGKQASGYLSDFRKMYNAGYKCGSHGRTEYACPGCRRSGSQSGQ